MVMPSTTLCGSLSRMERSMNAPGSPSSALQTTYLDCPGDLRQSSHLTPVRNPAAAAAAQAGFLHLFGSRHRASSR